MIHTLKRITVVTLLGVAFSPFFVVGQSVSDLQAQINVLLQRVQQLQTQLSQLRNIGTGQSCFYFNNNIGIGASGGDVGPLATALSTQGFLNTPINTSNLLFDETLASAVSAFQEKYRSEILAPQGLVAGTGYVGPATRAKLNSLYGCGGIITPPPSSGLSVSYLSPSSGPIGTQVTIVGSGFTSTGNKVIFVNLGTENNPTYSLNSYDGRTLTFTIPSSDYYACLYTYPSCAIPQRLTQPGSYSVSVMNPNGTSNSVNFTVTSGGTFSGGITPTYAVPIISYLSPATGSRGTEVIIVGSNFTPSDSVQFSDLGTYMAHNYVSSNSLTFTVPSSLTNCNISGMGCTNIYSVITNGSYNIRVINGNGTSNSISFTMTGVSDY